jgi:cytochrome c-type biogenesis protein CcsB
VTVEIVLMWIALTFYVAGTAMFVGGVVFEAEKWTRRAVLVSAIGLVPQTVSMAMRWIRLGHGPYLGYYELTSTLTFFTVLLLIGMAWRYPKTSGAGIVIMPVALLLIGAAMTAPKGGLDVGPTLASYWLFIHIVFSDLAFGCFVLSFGLAVAYVIRARSADGPWARRLSRLPDQDTVDHLSGRFVIAAFLFWGIMIASGAIWANEAWGRYWGWDPIETWSLVVWIIYAVYLHLRLTLGWRGERIAWYAIVAMPVAMFCLAGIPFLYKASIHTGYLAG